MKNEDTILNFLYCFDTNYNYQAFSSIISLLDCINVKINIYILHNDKTNLQIPEPIFKHKNLKKISIYQFRDSNYDFPNLTDNHVSEATYYRMFINNYLPKNLESIIYIDADMIFVRNPITKFQLELNNLIISKYVVAAKTEININNYKPEDIDRIRATIFSHKFWPFDRIPIQEKYFNAGLLIIDMNKWRESNIQNKLIKTMYKEYENILMWDQDVINCVINGKYHNLTNELNFLSTKLKKDSKLPYTLHYSGSNKPWKTNGAFEFAAKFYHLNFKKISNIEYHIEIDNKKNSLKSLFDNILNLNFFKTHKPIRYLLIFYKKLITR